MVRFLKEGPEDKPVIMFVLLPADICSVNFSQITQLCLSHCMTWYIIRKFLLRSIVGHAQVAIIAEMLTFPSGLAPDWTWQHLSHSSYEEVNQFALLTGFICHQKWVLFLNFRCDLNTCALQASRKFLHHATIAALLLSPISLDMGRSRKCAVLTRMHMLHFSSCKYIRVVIHFSQAN